MAKTRKSKKNGVKGVTVAPNGNWIYRNGEGHSLYLPRKSGDAPFEIGGEWYIWRKSQNIVYCPLDTIVDYGVDYEGDEYPIYGGLHWGQMTATDFLNDNLSYGSNLFVKNEMVTAIAETVGISSLDGVVACGLGGFGVNWTFTKEGVVTFTGKGVVADEHYPMLGMFPRCRPNEGKPCNTLVIGEGITGIADKAFTYSSTLKRVVLPDTLKEIGERAFFNCTNLTSVTIPDSVTTIGKRAFDGCTGLTSVQFGANSKLKKIEKWAFINCPSLKQIVVPFGTTIGEEAFGFKAEDDYYWHIKPIEEFSLSYRE